WGAARLGKGSLESPNFARNAPSACAPGRGTRGRPRRSGWGGRRWLGAAPAEEAAGPNESECGHGEEEGAVGLVGGADGGLGEGGLGVFLAACAAGDNAEGGPAEEELEDDDGDEGAAGAGEGAG